MPCKIKRKSKLDKLSKEDNMSSKIPITSEGSSDSKATLSIAAQTTNDPKSNTVHPLASIYKKSELQESKPVFKFFPAAGEQNDDDLNQIEVSPQRSRERSPLTPFTKKDFESRVIRSPAPTPDTAYHNKYFSYPSHDEGGSPSEEGQGRKEKNDSRQLLVALEHDIEETSIEAMDVSRRNNIDDDDEFRKEDDQETQSDFQKWFWANQGQINRGWKKRRKVVLKEQRQKNKITSK